MEQFVKDIKTFQELTKQYTGENRPLWITEMGWATPPSYSESARRIVDASLKILYPEGVKGAIALLNDEKYDSCATCPVNFLQAAVPPEVQTKSVTLADLPNLSVETYPGLILPFGETFPTPYFNDLKEYVKRGGTLFLMGGVPIYYETAWQNGSLSRNGRGCSEELRKQMRIGWRAWWTVKGTPEKAPVFVSREAAPFLSGYQPVLEVGRFLTPNLLKDGDRFIPLLEGRTKDFQAPGAAALDFNSDWKGAVVVSMIMDSLNTNACTADNQGVFLPQAYLTALANGVDRFFWYEFQAVEQDNVDKEHHFGMVHRDLSPKPGYTAYQAMTKARPEGSVQLPGERGGALCKVGWIRPDGKKGWAIWVCGSETESSCKISGDIDQAFDYLGVPVQIHLNSGKLKLSTKILYLIGPDSVELQPE